MPDAHQFTGLWLEPGGGWLTDPHGPSATLIESPPAGASAAPECRGGGRLARRADDRQPARRGHPAEAPPRAFLRAAARAHLRADLAPARPQHDRQPGDAAAVVRGGRGDEGAGRPGLSRPADRLAARRSSARATSPTRFTIWRCCARWSGSAARWSSRRSTRRTRSIPRARSRRPKRRSTGSPRKAPAKAAVKSFAAATELAVQMAEKALNTGGGLSGLTTGLDTLNAQDRRPPQQRPRHPRRPSGHGQDRARHQHRVQRRAALSCRTWRTASRRRNRPAPASPSSASKCRPTSSPPASSPSNRGISSEMLRMGKISQQDFRNLARAAADLETLPLYIDDTPGLTIAALRTRARRMKRQQRHRPRRRRLSPVAAGHRAQLATTIASRRFPKSRAA